MKLWVRIPERSKDSLGNYGQDNTLHQNNSIRKMKHKEYHVANFATFVSKTLIPPPPRKMDEFNFRLV